MNSKCWVPYIKIKESSINNRNQVFEKNEQAEFHYGTMAQKSGTTKFGLMKYHKKINRNMEFATGYSLASKELISY